MAQGLSEKEVQGLLAPFPDEMVDLIRGFKYIPIEYVIERLNNVFNYNWDCIPVSTPEVGEKEIRKGKNGEEYTVFPIYVTVILTVRSETGAVISRSGCGGSISGYGKSEGDGHKGAMSDAIRKAAQSFGIALYIAQEARVNRKKGGNRGGYNKQGSGFRPPMSTPSLNPQAPPNQQVSRVAPPKF